jgi:hypothetical protein
VKVFTVDEMLEQQEARRLEVEKSRKWVEAVMVEMLKLDDAALEHAIEMQEGAVRRMKLEIEAINEIIDRERVALKGRAAKL